MSRPTRARGLKCLFRVVQASASLSRPTRARGLKCHSQRSINLQITVAPHAGAWIEIRSFFVIRM